MAANKRTLKQHGQRTRASSKAAVRPDPQFTAMVSERRALMRADAILRCVAVALEYDDWSFDEPDYAEAIEVARNLILQSIERLESRSSSSPAGSVTSGRERST
jgi:hypothetical protein